MLALTNLRSEPRSEVQMGSSSYPSKAEYDPPGDKLNRGQNRKGPSEQSCDGAR
jgi:hypothetical protein